MSHPIVFFGNAASSYVRTARMVCHEKGLPHALEAMPPGSEANLKVHPWGKVPAMRHGDLHLIETSAMARYLDEIGSGPSLLPGTAAARALMEQWISSINSYLYDSLIRGYALKYILAKVRNEELDAQGIAANTPAMERDVARLDAAYQDRAWIAGEALSLADLFVAPIVQTVAMFPAGKAAVERAPALSRAFAALERRDSFIKAHAGLFGR
jgi:glutathione S-transferase